MTINVGAGTALGSYTLTVTGTSGSTTHSATVTLNVTSASSAATVTTLMDIASLPLTASPATTVTVNTAGDLLVWCVNADLAAGNGYNVTAPTDSQGNGWASIATKYGSVGLTASCWWTAARSGGADTITGHVGSAGADRQYISVFEVAGANTASPLDGVTAIETSATTSWSALDAVGTAGDLVMANFYPGVQGSSIAAGTIGGSAVDGSVSHRVNIYEWKQNVNSGSQSATASGDTDSQSEAIVWAIKTH
jgi:hypothetical protein